MANTLDDSPEAVELPTDHPRPARLRRAPDTEHFELAAEPLARLADELGAGVFTMVLAGFQVIVHRYGGQGRFVIGSPAIPEPMHADVAGNPTMRELISRVHQQVLAARARVGAGADVDITTAPGAVTVPAADGAGFELALSFQHSGDRLSGEIAYSPELFDPPTIRRLIGHLKTVLAALALDHGLRVGDVPLLTQAERHQLLTGWNDTSVAYPAELCLFQLIERQAHRAPDAVALVHGTVQVSYGDLNTRANQIAHRLRALGVRAGTLVGIFAERGPEMVTGLLGVLKAGGAYVPLDPEYPAARLSFMLDDSAVPIVLTLEQLAHRLPASSATVIRLDADAAEIARYPATDLPPLTIPADLAYVTYTSGSTGRPKGVMVEHRSVVSFVTAGSFVRVGPDRVFFQFVPVSFDVSAFEIWAALANGSRLVIAPAGRPDASRLARLVRDEGVTTLWLTSPLFHEMVAHHATEISGVEELIAGGDVVSPAHFDAMLAAPGQRLVINGYGPTEATVLACTFAASSDDASDGLAAARVPIGRPIGNATAYVLDQYGNPVPVGVIGELCLGGTGVARGYLGHPRMTAERFVPDPFGSASGGRLYRTGDRARYLPDGTIDFLGRADHQIKIRGFRVEAGEIEAALAAHPAVRDCVVIGSGGNSKRLVGYVVTAGEPPTAQSLRQFLAQKLPDYMLPAAFVVVDALPLTPNGKVDRSALPEPADDRVVQDEPAAEPATATERLILPIVADILQRDRVSVHDNFFDLGCDSLQVLRLLAIISEAVGVEVEVEDLYDHPTVAELGERLTRR